MRVTLALSGLLLIAGTAAAQPRGPRRDGGPPPPGGQGSAEPSPPPPEEPRPAPPPRRPRDEPPPREEEDAEPRPAASAAEVPAEPAEALAASSSATASLAEFHPAAPAEAALPAVAAAATAASAPSSLLPLAAVLAAAGVMLFGLWKFLSGLLAEPPITGPVAPSRPATAPAGPKTTAPTDPVTAPAPAPGTAAGQVVGGNYEVRRQLGLGGMGVVYEAWDRALDRRVALKKMRPEIGASPRGRDRFLSEAKLVAKLSHPNIVSIHQILEEAGDLYLVFEYVDGITLDELLLREKFVPPAQALKILRGVSEAVDAAHQEKVIHRDLKPANIMIDKAGRPKVMDFGIAHQAKLTVSQLTVAEAFGSVAYMPPEQELGQAVRESDIYAFAAVTYELLTGGLPFPGPNFHLQKSTLTFLRPSEADGTLPRALDTVFERAFAPEPKARYPTTGAFVSALSDILKT